MGTASFFLGLHIKTASGCITIPTTLLMCSVDLPARSLYANMKQFNGCIYCENPGTLCLSCPCVCDWVPGAHNLHTHQSIIQNAREAAEGREAVCNMFIYVLYSMDTINVSPVPVQVLCVLSYVYCILF